MYETRTMSDCRTLKLIDSVGSLARGRIRLLNTQTLQGANETEEQYLQALHAHISEFGYYTFEVLCQIIRLAHLYACKSRFAEFENALNEAERIYMCLAQEPDSGLLVDLLIGLNWQLCTIGRGKEARRVNTLVAQIKMLDQEAAAAS